MFEGVVFLLFPFFFFKLALIFFNYFLHWNVHDFCHIFKTFSTVLYIICVNWWWCFQSPLGQKLNKNLKIWKNLNTVSKTCWCFAPHASGGKKARGDRLSHFLSHVTVWGGDTPHLHDEGGAIALAQSEFDTRAYFLFSATGWVIPGIGLFLK